MNTPTQTAPMDALVIMQAARLGLPFASNGYRILDAAICHLIGVRASSVDYVTGVE